jgi:hypothetical protein
MCQVKVTVQPGLIDSENVAVIDTFEGQEEEVIVSKRQIERKQNVDYLKAHAICEDVKEAKVLIELPSESTTGQWRIWINKNNIFLK